MTSVGGNHPGVLAEDIDGLAALLTAARAKRDEQARLQRERDDRERLQRRDGAVQRLVLLLKQSLGIVVPPARVVITDSEHEWTREDGDAFIEVTFGGVTFSYRHPSRWAAREDRRALCVQRRCLRTGCDLPLWIEIEDSYDLLDALEEIELQQHRWACNGEEFDEALFDRIPTRAP